MTSSKNSIVIDSNVWISALVFGGNPRRVFEQVIQASVSIVISPEIETEIRRNLYAKFPDFIEDFDELLYILRNHIQYVKLGLVEVTASRDADDNRVLETALLGRANYIVSGDNDLLSLVNYSDVTIITPTNYLAL